MKRIVIMVAMAVLLLSVAVQAQAPVPKPGPEQKKLEIWVGDWTFAEEGPATPFGPAYKISGKTSVKPILGSFFIEFSSEAKGTLGSVQYFEVDSYNPETKKYTWNGFGSDGSIHTVTYTIEGTSVPYAGTQIISGKQAKIRGTVTFTADFMSWEEKREISADGKTWMPFFHNKTTKVKSSPK